MYCPHCGNDIADTSTYCRYCGSKFITISEERNSSESLSFNRTMDQTSTKTGRDDKLPLKKIIMVVIGIPVFIFLIFAVFHEWNNTSNQDTFSKKQSAEQNLIIASDNDLNEYLGEESNNNTLNESIESTETDIPPEKPAWKELQSQIDTPYFSVKIPTSWKNNTAVHEEYITDNGEREYICMVVDSIIDSLDVPILFEILVSNKPLDSSSNSNCSVLGTISDYLGKIYHVYVLLPSEDVESPDSEGLKEWLRYSHYANLYTNVSTVIQAIELKSSFNSEETEFSIPVEPHVGTWIVVSTMFGPYDVEENGDAYVVLRDDGSCNIHLDGEDDWCHYSLNGNEIGLKTGDDVMMGGTIDGNTMTLGFADGLTYHLVKHD